MKKQKTYAWFLKAGDTFQFEGNPKEYVFNYRTKAKGQEIEFSYTEKERKITESIKTKTNQVFTVLEENKNVESKYTKELKIGDIVYNPEGNFYQDKITSIKNPKGTKTGTTFITCNDSILPSFSLKQNGFIGIQKK